LTYALPGNYDSQVFASTFFAQAANFGPDYTARMAKYQNCWDFYDGRHWKITAPEGADQITINYAKAFVKKMRRFAFRNGWTMAFSEEQRADKLDAWCVDTWNSNDKINLTNQIGEHGGIFGDWYLYVQWLPDEKLDDEIPQFPKLRILDPRYVFPQYNDRTGEMEFCVIIVPYQDFELHGNTFELSDRIHREIHTKDKIYVQDFDNDNNIVDEKILDNPIGKILVIHGLYQPKAGSLFGSGIVEDIIGPQKLLDEKISNTSEILDYHAAPITIIYGAKARQLEKGANKIWSGLPANAKVENLSSEGNIPASQEFVKEIKTWMHELSNIPEDALGADKKISNTSAVALSISYEPLIEIAEDIRYYFAKGIKEINELIIDIGIETGRVNSSLKAPHLYASDITFGSLLPRDRAMDLADIATELNLGLETKEGALQRLGVKDTKSKMEEIDNEEEEDKKRAMELAMKYPPPMIPTDNGPDDGPDAFGKNTGKTPRERKATKTVNTNPAVHGEQVTNDNKLKKG
jgi:hypothetical protein